MSQNPHLGSSVVTNFSMRFDVMDYIILPSSSNTIVPPVDIKGNSVFTALSVLQSMSIAIECILKSVATELLLFYLHVVRY